MAATGYEHFGVLVRSAEDLAHVTNELKTKHPSVTLSPQATTKGGHQTIRFRHLLPLAVEAQYFPDITRPA